MYDAVSRYFEDFIGQCKVPATASGAGNAWVTAVTGTTPTIIGVTNSACGLVKLTLTNTSEAQTAQLYHGDICSFKADDLQTVSFRLNTAANIAANESLVFGMISAMATNPDNTAYNVQFKLDGSTAVVLESDDAVTDNDDKASGGITLGATLKEFMIDFHSGLSDVRFFTGGANGKLTRAGAGTLFNCAGLAGKFLQPGILLAKASGATTPSAFVDYVEVLHRRS